MFHEVFPNSIHFWKTTLISKTIFIPNLIRMDLYLMSAVELWSIPVVQGKPTSSISRWSAGREDSLLLFQVVAPKHSSWAPHNSGHSSHTDNRKHLLQRSGRQRQLIQEVHKWTATLRSYSTSSLTGRYFLCYYSLLSICILNITMSF